MQVTKVELDAMKEVVDQVTEGVVTELADLQLAVVGGGTTDVTFY